MDKLSQYIGHGAGFTQGEAATAYMLLKYGSHGGHAMLAPDFETEAPRPAAQAKKSVAVAREIAAYLAGQDKKAFSLESAADTIKNHASSFANGAIHSLELPGALLRTGLAEPKGRALLSGAAGLLAPSAVAAGGAYALGRHHGKAADKPKESVEKVAELLARTMLKMAAAVPGAIVDQNAVEPAGAAPSKNQPGIPSAATVPEGAGTPLPGESVAADATQEPMVDAGPGGLDAETTAYIAQERALQQAALQQEAAHFRGEAQQAIQQVQQLQQQLEQLGQSNQQSEQTIQDVTSQLEAAHAQVNIAQTAALQNVQQAHQLASNQTQAAMRAMSEKLQQGQLAAQIYQAGQQRNQDIMQMLAQDPTKALAAQLIAPPPPAGQTPNGAPGQPVEAGAVPSADSPIAAEGPASQADTQATAPGTGGPDSAGGGGSATANAKSDGGQDKKPKDDGGPGDKITIEKSAAMSQTMERWLHPASLVGAGIGAASGALGARATSRMDTTGMKQQIANQEAAGPPGTFAGAMSLAALKSRLAAVEAAKAHPGGAMAAGALAGASAGYGKGKSIYNLGKNSVQYATGALKNMRAELAHLPPLD